MMLLPEVTQPLPNHEIFGGPTGNQININAIYNEIHERGGLDGKKILVVGSGDNTESWKKLNCITLDINKDVSPDLNIDANNLEPATIQGGYDIVYCEKLSMDTDKICGVDITSLMEGARKVLKDGGMIVYDSAVVDREGMYYEEGLYYEQRMLPVVSDLIANASNFSSYRVVTDDGTSIVTDPRQIGDELIASGIYYESRVLFVAVK